MKRLLALLFCALMLGSLLILPASALNYYVTHYEENIYAGGIVDLYAFPNEGNTEDFTYQWQFDAGFGGNHSWYDVPDNDIYSGGKTNHLQIHTSTGVYDGWEAIPFQCIVTSSDGTVRKTANITVEIYPTEKLFPAMKKWGYGLYTPHVTNAIDMYTADEVNYTASAYAGTKLKVMCGSKSIDDKPVLRRSEIDIKTEIHITENGHTTVTANNSSYIPYTVGQLKVEFKQKVTIGEYDLGYFDTNTVNVTVSQPATKMTAQVRSDCSLLRYTYNESQKLASIPKGTTLDIVGEDGSYYQVYYDGYVGYVGKSLMDTTADATGKLIKEVDLTIPHPVAGQTPTNACTVETDTCALYHTDPVTWTDEAGKIVTGKFQEGKRYTVSIWLSAKSGYEFPTDASGNPKLGATINGDLPPYISKAYEQDPKQVIDLSYTFAPTQKAPEEPETVVIEPAETKPSAAPAHTHTPSAWRCTGIYHYKACTTCGDFLTAEDHAGGSASCTGEGLCAVCGYAYLPSTEDHAPDTTKWTACGDLYHAHICKLCGAHCDAQDHTPGPEATDTTPQTCTVCGYVITPAKNHKHDLTKVPATPADCINGGNIQYYFCTGCNDCFTDEQGKNKIPETMSVETLPLGHTVSDTWSFDGQFHWRTCTRCGTVLTETKLVHESFGENCTTCGYVMGSGETSSEFEPSANGSDPTRETRPTETRETVPGDKNSNGSGVSWITIVLVALVCFGAGITATVIIMKNKKKE